MIRRRLQRVADQILHHQQKDVGLPVVKPTMGMAVQNAPNTPRLSRRI